MGFFDHPLSKEEYQFHAYDVSGKQMLAILTGVMGILNLWYGYGQWPINQNPKKIRQKK